jgi:hypothetical protein
MSEFEIEKRFDEILKVSIFSVVFCYLFSWDELEKLDFLYSINELKIVF